MQERGAAPALTEPRPPGGTRRLLVALGTAALVVTADQLSKNWAVHRLAQGQVHVVWKLDLVLSYNSGSAFGLAQGWAPVIGALAALVVVGILAVVRGVHSDGVAVALGLVLGGAVGNLADRIFRGHHGAVVDFIDFHFWPTFNVADSCITVGVILTVALLWRADVAHAEP